MSNKKQIKMECILKPDYITFWNINRLCSYKGVSTFVSVGGRGIGKTTSGVLYVGNNYIKKKEEFVYLRRYKDEIKASRDIFDGKFLGVSSRGFGVDGAFEYVNGADRIGYGVALSIQHKLKSGVDFSKVTTILFDEAILKPGGTKRYLHNEITELLEFISTVSRLRKNVKVFIIGNNQDLFNPYFEYFKVPRFIDNYVDNKRGLYCEYCKNKPELVEKEQETPLYKLTQDTAYGDYHYKNAAMVTENVKLGIKNKNAIFLFRLLYNTITLNIYLNSPTDCFVELRDKVIKDSSTMIMYENNNPNYLYIKQLRNMDCYKLLRKMFFNDRVIYSDTKAGDLLKDIMEELE